MALEDLETRPVLDQKMPMGFGDSLISRSCSRGAPAEGDAGC